MYLNQQITRNEQGKWLFTITTAKGVLIYHEECISEKNARNGGIRFALNGPNVPGLPARYLSEYCASDDIQDIPEGYNGEDYLRD